LEISLNIVSPNAGTKNINIISIININVITKAFIRFGTNFCGSIPYIMSDAVITELAPPDANQNPVNKKTIILKSNPLPFKRGNNKLPTAEGKVSLINSVIELIDIEKVDAIITTSTSIGIIVNTKEKANCPGKIDITGFCIISITS
jgi:hypothetical protein